MFERAGREHNLEAGFWVGRYFVAPRLNRISTAEQAVGVEPKLMHVLLCLAERPAEVVTKKEFMERVWGDTVVTDDALLRCISGLRKIFGDDPTAPRFIETIRKVGYRLIAPVSLEPPASAASEQARRRAGAVLSSGRAAAAQHSADAVPVDLRPLGHALLQRLGCLLRQQVRSLRFWTAVAATLVLLAGGLLWLLRAFHADAQGPSEAPALAGLPIDGSGPVLSPDGRHAAFVWDGGDGGDFDIYIKRRDGETPLRITDSPADEHSPAWSPDGRYIAFVRSTDDAIERPGLD